MIKNKNKKYIDIKIDPYINELDKHFYFLEEKFIGDLIPDEFTEVDQFSELSWNTYNLIIEYNKPIPNIIYESTFILTSNQRLKSKRTGKICQKGITLDFYNIDLNYIDSFIKKILKEYNLNITDIVVYRIIS